MGDGRWEMGSGKWEVGSGKWEVNGAGVLHCSPSAHVSRKVAITLRVMSTVLSNYTIAKARSTTTAASRATTRFG